MDPGPNGIPSKPGRYLHGGSGPSSDPQKLSKNSSQPNSIQISKKCTLGNEILKF